MNRFVTNCIFVVAFALVAVCSVVGQAQTLRTARIETLTQRDNKDGNTALYVQVQKATKDGLIAELKNGAAAKEFRDKEENTTTIPVLAPEVTKDECKGFVFRIGIKATGGIGKEGGNDHWEFNAKVILDFGDGTTPVELIGRVPSPSEITSRGNVEWTEWVTQQ